MQFLTIELCTDGEGVGKFVGESAARFGEVGASATTAADHFGGGLDAIVGGDASLEQFLADGCR